MHKHSLPFISERVQFLDITVGVRSYIQGLCFTLIKTLIAEINTRPRVKQHRCSSQLLKSTLATNKFLSKIDPTKNPLDNGISRLEEQTLWQYQI